MHFFYVDESAGTQKNEYDRFYLLGVIIIDSPKLRDVEQDVRDLATQFAKDLSLPKNVELHGHDVYAGKGAFKGKTITDRISVFRRLVEILPKRDLRVAYVRIQEKDYFANAHPHQMAFTILMEQVEDFLTRKDSLGLIVADENDRFEERLVAALEMFKTLSTAFGWRPTKVEHVADSIHFVRSKHNRLIQLADVVSGVISRGLAIEEKLLATFLEEEKKQTTELNWPAWWQQHGTQSQKVNMELWQSVHKHIAFAKTFPKGS